MKTDECKRVMAESWLKGEFMGVSCSTKGQSVNGVGAEGMPRLLGWGVHTDEVAFVREWSIGRLISSGY